MRKVFILEPERYEFLLNLEQNNKNQSISTDNLEGKGPSESVHQKIEVHPEKLLQEKDQKCRENKLVKHHEEEEEYINPVMPPPPGFPVQNKTERNLKVSNIGAEKNKLKNPKRSIDGKNKSWKQLWQE